MQVQVFRNAAERMGDKVIKLDMTAVLADSDGKAIPSQKVKFMLEKKVIAEAVTSDTGEAGTGTVLVELPDNAPSMIWAIPEGYAIRGQIDISDLLTYKPATSASNSSVTQPTPPEPPKYDKLQGLDPEKNKILYHFLWGTGGIFLGTHLFLFCAALIYAAGGLSSRGINNMATTAFIAAILGGIGFTIVSMILLYRHWESLQVESISVNPGQAVGFLLIPFFNCYWVFIAVYGLAKDYNRLIRQHGLSVPIASEKLALASAILYCISLISCGYLSLFALAVFGTFLMQLRKTAEAVYLAQRTQAAA